MLVATHEVTKGQDHPREKPQLMDVSTAIRRAADPKCIKPHLDDGCVIWKSHQKFIEPLLSDFGSWGPRCWVQSTDKK